MAFRRFAANLFTSRCQRFMRILVEPLERVVGEASGFRTLRIVIAIILLFAAAMKTYALWSPDVQTPTYFGMPLWVPEVGVVAEWILGAWLLVGVLPYLAWLCTLVCFGIFLCLSLRASIAGATACGCFGFLSTSPWLTSLMDAAILVALVVIRPSSEGRKPGGGCYELRKLLVRCGALIFTIFTATIVLCIGVIAQARELSPVYSNKF